MLKSDCYKRIRQALKLLKSERGSASIEFVSLAIPLFIPIFLFLNTFSAQSDLRNIAEDASRQAIRAYWASTNVVFAYSNARKSAELTARELGATEVEIAAMKLHYSCGKVVCWGPDTSLTITVSMGDKDGQVEGSATETSSRWAVG